MIRATLDTKLRVKKYEGVRMVDDGKFISIHEGMNRS